MMYAKGNCTARQVLPAKVSRLRSVRGRVFLSMNNIRHTVARTCSGLLVLFSTLESCAVPIIQLTQKGTRFIVYLTVIKQCSSHCRFFHLVKFHHQGAKHSSPGTLIHRRACSHQQITLCCADLTGTSDVPGSF